MDFKDNEYIVINFRNNDSIKLSLDPRNPELTTPEIAVFTNIKKEWYVFKSIKFQTYILTKFQHKCFLILFCV